MPIADYTKEYERALKHIMQSDEVTEQNKQYITEFLNNYKNRNGKNKGLSVSDSRKQIFCRHAIYFLKHSKDIKQEMYERKIINSIFSKLENKLNRSTYATVVDVMIRFVKQLHDKNNEKPIGFQDIEYLKTEKKMDSFRAEDILTWDDILEMCKYTKSIQMKAILTCLIDGGFRPSEFIDIKFKDVRMVNHSYVVEVSGKTGRREVVLWKSVPYINDWLNSHPTKKGTDPLWIKENLYKNESNIQYRYEAIKKRIKELAKRAKIYKKGTSELKDLYGYAFRHACAKMYKNENVAPDWAASNLGHSVQFYTSVYGKESTEDRVNRSERHQGISKKKLEEEQNKICQICGNVNKPYEKMCSKCHNPLDLASAVEEINKAKKMEEQLQEMQKKLDMVMKLNQLKI